VVQKSGSSLTEQLVVTGNNSLQRATVCLNTVGAPCTPTTNGNWVMQMAVFRDASAIVSNAWSPSRIGQIRHANLFPGSDLGAQINNAYTDCPMVGCHIKVDAGTYSFSTPIVFGTLSKPAWLECDPGATLMNYTPSSGTAITLNWGSWSIGVNTAVSHPGLFGCAIRGIGGLEGGSSTAVGVADGTNGFAFSTIDGITVQGFAVGLQFNQMTSFRMCRS
jgi:hypothetical protein